LSDSQSVNRDGFLRALRRYCRKNGMFFRLDEARGKGGHAVVWVGERRTTVQSDLNESRVERILKQLGLDKNALR